MMLKNRTFNLVAFLSIGLLGLIFLTRAPFAQYYLMSLPFIAIIAAFNAHKLFNWNKNLTLFFLVVSAVVSAGVLFYTSESNKAQLQKINYVLSITDPEDRIYDGDANFNIFRKDISYFWFSVKPKTGVLNAYRLVRPYEYDTYKLIDELKPKIVSNSFIKKGNAAIVNHYIQSEFYKDIFIRKD